MSNRKRCDGGNISNALEVSPSGYMMVGISIQRIQHIPAHCFRHAPYTYIYATGCKQENISFMDTGQPKRSSTQLFMPEYIYIYMSFTFTYMKFIPSSLSLSLPFSSSTRPSLHFSKLSNYNLTNKYSYIRIFHQTHL